MLILTAIFPRVLLSHPHVFIVTRLEAVFDDKGLAGVRVRWGFDDMFSSMIAGDYDRNKNGQLEETEIALIKKEAFSYLANHDYFCFVKISDKPFKVKFVREFSAALNKGKLSYEFLIPCHVTAIDTFKEFRIAVYDPTYYSAVFFAEKRTVSIENGSSFETVTQIAENKKESYYYDMIHPWDLSLKFRLKK